ncbi:MAG: hydantoinase/oxoprolinase family protein [Planctomycetota bacterium]
MAQGDPLQPGPGSAFRIGVDTGGTFTDLILLDAAGCVVATHKRLSTPDDPGRAVLEGIDALIAATSCRGQLPGVVHGSTVATNALLEGKGDRAALLTTAGFEDVLYLARQDRPHLYDLVPTKEPPPIPRERTLGVAERINYAGQVLEPLTRGEVGRIVDHLEGLGVGAVSICLLHSYAKPAHEQAIAQAIRAALPGVHLTVSSELLPEMREYERSATCAVNAVVGPTMSRYVGRLDTQLGRGRLRIMGTGGGTLPPVVVGQRPVETILSGPAGGVMGAWAMAASAGLGGPGAGVIGFDMGGTSTDVCLIQDGPRRTTESVIAGLPIRLPMIDIHTVGAGGGSIAWVDEGGALRVGPQSAGAAPGPACYGRQEGERLVTVTDAHAVLGHIRDGRRLGDQLSVDRGAAVASVGSIAQRLGMTHHAAAEGILRVADAAMARAVQRVSVQQGYDARQLTLLAFGGAGGLHACRLAEALGMDRVLIPVNGGLLSALGMLSAPARFAFSQAVLTTLPHQVSGYEDPRTSPAVSDAIDQLVYRGRATLKDDGVAADDQLLVVQLDLRFAGQSYEITVRAEADGGPIEAFVNEHQRLYGYAPVGRPIELVAVRVVATGPVPVLSLQRPARGLARQATEHEVWDRGELSVWPFLERDALQSGGPKAGPMVIEEYAATTVVPRGWDVEVLADGQLMLTR